MDDVTALIKWINQHITCNQACWTTWRKPRRWTTQKGWGADSAALKAGCFFLCLRWHWIVCSIGRRAAQFCFGLFIRCSFLGSLSSSGHDFLITSCFPVGGQSQWISWGSFVPSSQSQWKLQGWTTQKRGYWICWVQCLRVLYDRGRRSTTPSSLELQVALDRSGFVIALSTLVVRSHFYKKWSWSR